MLSKNTLYAVISWSLVAWICKVFLTSLPYKFSGHPDTVHIFTTIGRWLSATFSAPLGDIFSRYGALLIGGAELATSLLLLSPLLLLLIQRLTGRSQLPVQSQLQLRAKLHAIGGVCAAIIMAGAVFFHLFTPLGVEVFHQGKSDGGSLFVAACSILIAGLILFILNRSLLHSG